MTRKRYVLLVKIFVAVSVGTSAVVCYRSMLRDRIPELTKSEIAVRECGWYGDDAAFVIAAASGNKKACEKYLAQGVKVDCKGKGGVTPLMAMVSSENTAGTELLLEHGADPELPDDNGMAAIDMATYSWHNKDPGVLGLILKHGGDPNHVCKATGNAVIFAAINFGSVSPAKVKLLVDAGADTTVQNEASETPMTAAAHMQSYEIIYYLLQKGVPLARDAKGKGHTVLYWIQHTVHDKPDSDGYQEKVTQWLKQHNLWRNEPADDRGDAKPPAS